jgi:hypothetical protein
MSKRDPVLLGDFDEIYHSRSATRGKLDCFFWAYSQVLKSIYPILKQRLVLQFVEAYCTFNRHRPELLIASVLLLAALCVPMTLFLMGAAPNSEYLGNANDETYALMLVVVLLAVGLEATFIGWCGVIVLDLCEERMTRRWLIPALLLWMTVFVTGYFLCPSGKLTSFWYRIAFLELIGPWLGLLALAGILTLCIYSKCFASRQLTQSEGHESSQPI